MDGRHAKGQVLLGGSHPFADRVHQFAELFWVHFTANKRITVREYKGGFWPKTRLLFPLGNNLPDNQESAVEKAREG
jgi:hypothetical protein